MPRQSEKLTLNEQQAFSQRLTTALVATDILVSASVVQREFNALSADKPITTHAVRKWIMGEAIPTQQRVRVLAALLGVTASWLRFGEDTKTKASQNLSANEHVLLQNFRQLSARERDQLQALIGTMARGRQKK